MPTYNRLAVSIIWFSIVLNNLSCLPLYRSVNTKHKLFLIHSHSCSHAATSLHLCRYFCSHVRDSTSFLSFSQRAIPLSDAPSLAGSFPSSSLSCCLSSPPGNRPGVHVGGPCNGLQALSTEPGIKSLGCQRQVLSHKSWGRHVHPGK